MKTLTASFLFCINLTVFAPNVGGATVLYVFSSREQLYRSDDRAKTWQLVGFPGEPCSSSVVAVDPTNTSTIYISCQPVSAKGSAGGANPGPINFYRSTDGGVTWTASHAPYPGQRLAIDPTSPNILYLGTGFGLFRSVDSASTWAATTLTGAITGIGTDPQQPGVLYATTYVLGALPGVYKSTDFGVTWTLLTHIQSSIITFMFSAAVDPRNSNVLYLPTTRQGCPGQPNSNCGLFRSTDAGKTWQGISGSAGDFYSVVIDPRNGAIYAGGVFTTLDAGSSSLVSHARVLKSTDGGTTWAQNSIGGSSFSVELQLDPEVETTIYSGQSPYALEGSGPGAGVYSSTNGGVAWTLSFVASGLLVSDDKVHSLVAVSLKSTPPSPPAISTNGVVNGASFLPGIVPNSWATIKGSNLAAVTDTWDKSIVNGKLPATLDGVTVSIGSKPAYLYYINPGQINLVVPDVGSGPMPVTVTTAVGTSTAFSVTSSMYGPAFFTWPGSQAVASRQDFSIAAKNGTFAGATTVPAKPGDVIILWGTGFGPTTPAAPTGVQVPADMTYSTSTLPVVTVNNVPATVYGAALASGFAGLYQVAIQIPITLADGDWPIQASIGGAQSPAGTVLTVGH
jgi:uncharacterized protein (TIGR03437 family)